MSDRTEALIQRLTRGLEPVRRLPSLGRVAASVALLAAALVAARLWFGWAGGSPWHKPDFAALDAGTIAAHALLFAGALAFALGACVPGRERLGRRGLLLLAPALAAIAWIASERLALFAGQAALAPGWLGATFSCSLDSILPAALPLLLVARFAARAAPRHAGLVLVSGAASALGLQSLPGVLGCDYPDQLHQLTAHLFVPALGALLLGLVAVPIFSWLRPAPPA